MIRPNVDMMEALRLTRQGRLRKRWPSCAERHPSSEAVRRAGSEEADGARSRHGAALEETGSAWTAPPAGARPARRDVRDWPAPSSIPADFWIACASSTSQAGRGRGRGRMKPATVVVPAGAKFETHDFTNEAGSRRYKLYVPSRYKGEPLPLVVMLHGCTQSPDDFAAGTRMNECAEEHGLLRRLPGATASANPSKCWNWFEGSEQRRGHGEPSLIAGITRQIMRDFPVEAGPRLRRRSLRRRCGGGHHGSDLSGSLCSRWRAFRIGVRRRARHSVRLRSHAQWRGRRHDRAGARPRFQPSCFMATETRRSIR